MKNILLFIVALFLGIILVIGYKQLFSDKKNVLIHTSPATITQFSIEKAPSTSLRGTILSYSGDVEWQSRTATQPAKLTSPISLQQGEGITTGDDGKIIIQISDVASVSALPNSSLNFMQTLPADLVMQQDSGSISYTRVGITPVSIRSLNLLTTIQKGMIMLSVDINQHIITVTVQKGSVTEGFNDIQNLSNVVTVNEGYQFIFNRDSKKGIVR